MALDIHHLLAVDPSADSDGCLAQSERFAVLNALNADKTARKDLQEFYLLFPCKDGKGFQVVYWDKHFQGWYLRSGRLYKVRGYCRFLRLK